MAVKARYVIRCSDVCKVADDGDGQEKGKEANMEVESTKNETKP